MPSLDTLLVFTAAAVLMNLSPGPSNFYVMSRSVSQGFRAGAVAALGLATGTLVHVAAAALGLAALFHYSPAAYTAVRIAGALYLIYLGLRCLRGQHSGSGRRQGEEAKPYRRIFAESIVVETLNPKTALFFIALLPQFVDVSLGTPALQILVLGTLVTITALPCDLAVAWSSGAVAKLLSKRSPYYRVLDWISGSILIGLGLYVALVKRSS